MQTGTTKVKGSKKSRRMMGSVRAKAGLPAKAGNRKTQHIMSTTDKHGKRNFLSATPKEAAELHKEFGGGRTLTAVPAKGDAAGGVNSAHEWSQSDVRRFKMRRRSYEISTKTGGYRDFRGNAAQHVPQDRGTVEHNCSHLVITGKQPELYDLVKAVVNET